MAQEGFTQCGCCGNLYKSDGSEQEMYDQDHPNLPKEIGISGMVEFRLLITKFGLI
jgi:hypothetical protein